MTLPNLLPVSTTSLVVLPSTGSTSDVYTSLPFGFYADSTSDYYSSDFISGAVDQVTYVYRKLGGDVLDIELVPANVYTAYEEATLEYSYIVNLHQAKNVMSSMLGATTGTFDHDGLLKDGQLKTDLSGSHIGLMFPKVKFGISQKVSNFVGTQVGAGGDQDIYSASFDIIENIQDYNLQAIISGSSAFTSSVDFYQKVGNKKIEVRRIYYKTPSAAWRFFGIYGGLNVAGNLMNYNLYSYGQYSDQTTYEVVPVWEHKLQARAYQDAIYTRCSHWSYELKNNKLRIYPIPTSLSITPSKFWIQFSIPTDVWKEEGAMDTGINGVNNMNTLPFEHIPFGNINSVGKQWIKNYALAVCKEMLGQIRGKFATLPIPNASVTLNAEQLLSQGKEEKEKLKDELKSVLEELTYAKLAEQEAAMAESTQKVNSFSPSLIYIG
jgi:hypothetical protein